MKTLFMSLIAGVILYFQIDFFSESALKSLIYPLLFGLCVLVFVISFFSKVWKGPMWVEPMEGEKRVIRKYLQSVGIQVLVIPTSNMWMMTKNSIINAKINANTRMQSDPQKAAPFAGA